MSRTRGSLTQLVSSDDDEDEPSLDTTQSVFTAALSPVANIRRRLETLLSRSPRPVQPTAAKCPTVSKDFLEKQRTLLMKHGQARSVPQAAGGVSLWPGMDNMRLTSGELTQLLTGCALILVATVYVFNFMHGTLVRNLDSYSGRIKKITSELQMLVLCGGEQSGLLAWHNTLHTAMGELEARFSVSLGTAPILDHVIIWLYIAGIVSLLYLLYDNMVTKSKLTPYRIKIWVSLLVLLMSWTLLSLRILVAAINLENTIQNTVLQLNELLGHALHCSHSDLAQYRSIVEYWRVRCLPPTSHGSLSLLGVVPVKDLTYYMSYYCVPIATALLAPLVKLTISLHQIYSARL